MDPEPGPSPCLSLKLLHSCSQLLPLRIPLAGPMFSSQSSVNQIRRALAQGVSHHIKISIEPQLLQLLLLLLLLKLLFLVQKGGLSGSLQTFR